MIKKDIKTYKFILMRIRELILDEYRRPEYLDAFDDVMFDLFGRKNIAKKIARSYENGVIIRIIDSVGYSYLMDLMNDPKYYAVLNDMVSLMYHLDDLKRTIRKNNRRGKRDHDLTKEYRYLDDLYKKSLKYLRKKLNIKNPKTAYKRRYQALDSVVKRSGGYGTFEDYDFDLGGFSLDDDDDDFDDYEYEGASPYEDYLRELNGIDHRHPSRRANDKMRRYGVMGSDMQDDDDLDFADDDLDKKDDRIDRLAGVVEELASSVNDIMLQRQYTGFHPEENDDYPEETRSLAEIQEEEEESPKPQDSVIDEKILKELITIGATQNQLTAAVKNLYDWRDEMERIIFEYEEEDSEEPTSNEPKKEETDDTTPVAQMITEHNKTGGKTHSKN